jgi:uncharacterized peroxidase-related enzyme
MSRPLRSFTTRVPTWRPYLPTVEVEAATPAQREAMAVTPSNTGISPYVLMLAHDPESLAARTPLFNAIMYGRGGLSRAERELGAVGASIVNRCIYCAAVHASRYAQLTKDEEAMPRVFADGVDAELDPRARAILAFAVKLSATPPEAGPEDLAALRAVGLDDAEVLDLVMSASLFGWANRLMHTLGEAVEPD